MLTLAPRPLQGALYWAGGVRWCKVQQLPAEQPLQSLHLSSGLPVQTGSADMTQAGTTGMTAPALAAGTAGTACRHYRNNGVGTKCRQHSDGGAGTACRHYRKCEHRLSLRLAVATVHTCAGWHCKQAGREGACCDGSRCHASSPNRWAVKQQSPSDCLTQTGRPPCH